MRAANATIASLQCALDSADGRIHELEALAVLQNRKIREAMARADAATPKAASPA